MVMNDTKATVGQFSDKEQAETQNPIDMIGQWMALIIKLFTLSREVLERMNMDWSRMMKWLLTEHATELIVKSMKKTFHSASYYMEVQRLLEFRDLKIHKLNVGIQIQGQVSSPILISDLFGQEGPYKSMSPDTLSLMGKMYETHDSLRRRFCVVSTDGRISFDVLLLNLVSFGHKAPCSVADIHLLLEHKAIVLNEGETYAFFSDRADIGIWIIIFRRHLGKICFQAFLASEVTPDTMVRIIIPQPQPRLPVSE